MKTKTKTSLHVEISKDLADWLDRYCREHNVSKSKVIEESLRMYREVQEKVQEGLTLLEEDFKLLSELDSKLKEIVQKAEPLWRKLCDGAIASYGKFSIHVRNILDVYYLFTIAYEGRPIIGIEVALYANSFSTLLYKPKLTKEEADTIVKVLPILLTELVKNPKNLKNF